MKGKLCMESIYGTGGGLFRELFVNMSPPQRELIKFYPFDGATNAEPEQPRVSGQPRNIFEKGRNVGISLRHDICGIRLCESIHLVDVTHHQPMSHCKKRRIRKKYRKYAWTTENPSRKVIKMDDPVTGRQTFIMHPFFAHELKSKLMRDHERKINQALMHSI